MNINDEVHVNRESLDVAENEAQRAARLWATLNRTEQKVAIGYVEYNMGWRNCVRHFGLTGKDEFLEIVASINRKLGGGDIRRYTGSHRQQVNP